MKPETTVYYLVQHVGTSESGTEVSNVVGISLNKDKLEDSIKEYQTKDAEFVEELRRTNRLHWKTVKQYQIKETILI